MKYSKIFKDKFNCNNAEDVFNYLITSLKSKITSWDYFVNWAKVFDNIKKIEVDLNILNYLIGKENIEEEFESLVAEHPQIIRLIPILIACRENKFEILTNYSKEKFEYKEFILKENCISIEDIKDFTQKCGFLELLKNRRLKSLVDYLIGIEVGLDSNGRKNRCGTAMENIIEFYIKDLCANSKLAYIKQATKEKIKTEWGLNLRLDKSSRRIDFAVHSDKKLYLIETNFYSVGGSKLKSTAGEYATMFNFWKNDGHEFIWITDGFGWNSTQKPLEETFNNIDYILNLEMISKDILKDIII